jgi:hypothetical protein
MKKIVIICLVFIIYITIVSGITLNQFCLLQNYSIQNLSSIEYCVFDDGNMCELRTFYNGVCGKDYNKIKEKCTNEGEALEFGKCCNGFDSTYSWWNRHRMDYIGGTKCIKINFYQKLWIWITGKSPI